jgi:hypothetical protein
MGQPGGGVYRHTHSRLLGGLVRQPDRRKVIRTAPRGQFIDQGRLVGRKAEDLQTIYIR